MFINKIKKFIMYTKDTEKILSNLIDILKIDEDFFYKFRKFYLPISNHPVLNRDIIEFILVWLLIQNNFYKIYNKKLLNDPLSVLISNLIYKEDPIELLTKINYFYDEREPEKYIKKLIKTIKDYNRLIDTLLNFNKNTKFEDVKKENHLFIKNSPLRHCSENDIHMFTTNYGRIYVFSFFVLDIKNILCDTQTSGETYTPVEAVDFINRMAKFICMKEFGSDIRQQELYEPMSGTGFFLNSYIWENITSENAENLCQKLKNNDISFMSSYLSTINSKYVIYEKTGRDDLEIPCTCYDTFMTDKTSVNWNNKRSNFLTKEEYIKHFNLQ